MGLKNPFVISVYVSPAYKFMFPTNRKHNAKADADSSSNYSFSILKYQYQLVNLLSIEFVFNQNRTFI